MPFPALSPHADLGVVNPEWLDADHARLLAEVRLHHGACDDGDLDPEDLVWSLVVDLPVSILTPLVSDWRTWFEDELAMFDEEHPDRAAAYRSLMHEPLDDPVVVTIETGRVQIWDGWHRTATRILAPVGTIPAIVGILPDGPSLPELLTRPR